jgi:hypothetical protein
MRSRSPAKAGLVCRTYLKKVLLPHIGVEPAHQVLEIHKYSCGLMLGFALIWNKNLFFEIGSKYFESAQNAAIGR